MASSFSPSSSSSSSSSAAAAGPAPMTDDSAALFAEYLRYNRELNAARKVRRGFRDPPHLARAAGAEDDAAALPFYREVRDEIEAMLRAELAGLVPGVVLQ